MSHHANPTAVDFQNTEIAFRGLTQSELRRAHLLFQSLQAPLLASLGPKLLTFGLKLKLPLKPVLEATVFKQFCGGESIADCATTIERLAAQNVHTILDYSVEGVQSDETFDQATQKIIETIEAKKKFPSIAFCVFKCSGLAPFSLLEKASQELMQGSCDFLSAQPWQNFQDRVGKIAAKALEHRLPLMIDAEESWIQPAIDFCAERLMELHNREEVQVYSTVQFYRTDRMAYIQKLIERSAEKKFKVGLKIVRGAYMEKERERAEKLRLPSPIHPDKKSTDAAFNSGLKFLCSHLEQTALCVGTHNEESLRLLINLMDDLGLAKNDGRLYASQLLGMSDNLTFNLSAAGYNVAKYVPFGPVGETIPYLMRRAEENSSVTDQSGRELALIKKELQRRSML